MVSVRIDDYDAAIIAPGYMVGNGQKFAVGGKAHMASPAQRFVNDIPGWELQAGVSSVGFASNREGLAIWRPIGPEHFVDDFAGRTSSQRNARQRSNLTEATDI